jgi:hypothetical protein
VPVPLFWRKLKSCIARQQQLSRPRPNRPTMEKINLSKGSSGSWTRTIQKTENGTFVNKYIIYNYFPSSKQEEVPVKNPFKIKVEIYFCKALFRSTF